MPEIGTSGLMSGEGKRSATERQRHRASPRLYTPIRASPHETSRSSRLAAGLDAVIERRDVTDRTGRAGLRERAARGVRARYARAPGSLIAGSRMTRVPLAAVAAPLAIVMTIARRRGAPLRTLVYAAYCCPVSLVATPIGVDGVPGLPLREIRLLVNDCVFPTMPVPLNLMSVFASSRTDPASAPTPVTFPLMTLRSMLSEPLLSAWTPRTAFPVNTELLTITRLLVPAASPKLLRLECELSITASTVPLIGPTTMPVPPLSWTTCS
jgi:hypothetical protein